MVAVYPVVKFGEGRSPRRAHRQTLQRGCMCALVYGRVPSMAITSSAKKANRASKRKFVLNLRRRRAIHDTVKDARKTVGQDRKSQDAALKEAYQAIDKALKRGVIKKNTAARKKSRLVKFLKKAK